MINNKLGGFGPQMGLGALAGAGSTAVNTGNTVDGGWDWSAPLSGLGGLAAGAGAGYLGANALINRANIAAGNLDAKQLKKFQALAAKEGPLSAAKKLGLGSNITPGAASGTGMASKLAKGKGNSLAWIAKNPGSAKMIGAGLGGLVGASMLSRAVAGPRDQLAAADQQQFAQKDAQNQMRDMQLAYGNSGRSW